MSKAAGWFDVDKEGLAKLLERREKAFAIFELIQNAWDTDARRIVVELEPEGAAPFVTVKVVDDDTRGFTKLEHAFTLFAESDKKSDPTKRGRFNLGEKLVLALCRSAKVSSTTGTVYFDAAGRRRKAAEKTIVGSVFEASMRMTRAELDEVLAATRTLIAPEGRVTIINGVQLAPRIPVQVTYATLPTEVAVGDGLLRRAERRTTLRLYEVREGEKATLYEMGIPVVELQGDRWHVDVGQKVPLTFDRDNITPSYFRHVRVAVLNATADLLRVEDAKEAWVREAAGDARATETAVKTVTALRFGDKRVIDDPSDPEGTRMAVSQGYTVIHGGSLTAGEWENVKRSGAARPAGQVTPSPKPFSPDGAPLALVELKDETPRMREFRDLAVFIAKNAAYINDGIAVRFTLDTSWNFNAAYNRVENGWGVMTVSAAPGKAFTSFLVKEWLRLIIHELGHHFGHHLEASYHEALCRIGSRLPALAVESPEIFYLNATDLVANRCVVIESASSIVKSATPVADMIADEISRGAAPAIRTGAVVAGLLADEALCDNTIPGAEEGTK